jgi:putative transposase
MMMKRGVIVSYETIRAWCRTFGQAFANGLRRRRPRPGDKWHLDEVFIKIQGKNHYLWRAVDQHGNVLDILVTSRRDATAATRFFRRRCAPGAGSFAAVDADNGMNRPAPSSKTWTTRPSASC